MTNHPNRGLPAKLRRALDAPKLYAATHYAMALGAGTVFNWQQKKRRADLDRQSILWSLEDALREPRDGEWETTIGQLVLAVDLDQLATICRQLQAEHPSECPDCHNTSRTRYRIRTQDHICAFCRATWPRF